MFPLRLLTFNALMKDGVRPRLRALAPILEQSDFDVVCLQEVMWRANAVLIRRLARSFGYHLHSGAVLLEGGLVTLSRRPIVDGRFVRYPVTAPPRPEYLMRKGAQVVTLDGAVTVVNTHLSANRADDWSPGNPYDRVQRLELDRLAQLVAGIGSERPVVVVGDLNVPRGSAPLADFLTATGLIDSRAGDPDPTYRPTPRFPSPPAFDHVLLRPGLGAGTRLVFQDSVTLAAGQAGYLSDHYGIAADIRVVRAGLVDQEGCPSGEV